MGKVPGKRPKRSTPQLRRPPWHVAHAAVYRGCPPSQRGPTAQSWEPLTMPDEPLRLAWMSPADLTAEVDTAKPEDPEPPEDFPEAGEDIPTAYRCPKCSYEWSGKAK